MAYDVVTPTTPPPSRRRVVPILVALAVAAIVTGLIVAYAWAGNRANEPDTQVGDAVPTITIMGNLHLNDLAPGWTVGAACHALSPGYADVAAGAQVIVTDPAGKVVGTGTLGAGKVEVNPKLGSPAKICTFPFTVTGVPTGLSTYGIQVSHRGVLQYRETDLAGPVILDLG